jgi:hypothetical protein
VLVGTEALETRIHALERVPPLLQGKAAQFVPVRFVPDNKLERREKLRLGFDALVLSEMLGRKIDFGRIVHGDEQEAMKVKTRVLIGEVRKLTDKAAALLSNQSPPDLVLNRHCSGNSGKEDPHRRHAGSKDRRDPRLSGCRGAARPRLLLPHRPSGQNRRCRGSAQLLGGWLDGRTEGLERFSCGACGHRKAGVGPLWQLRDNFPEQDDGAVHQPG